MYLSDEMPTVEDSREQEQEARDFGADLELFDENIISTTLPVNAQTCYELFCDVARIPEWVTTVRSVQVLAFDDEGRPARAAFLASLGRASAGYTLEYDYYETRRMVTWSTPSDMMTRIAGRALFLPLTDRATMMHYQLDADWPEALGLGGMYDGHPASIALNDFRDFVSRTIMLS